MKKANDMKDILRVSDLQDEVPVVGVEGLISMIRDNDELLRAIRELTERNYKMLAFALHD
jgi:hypothetical protein